MTSITSDQDSSSTFIVDGLVKLFDRRLEEEDAIVRSYHGHHSWYITLNTTRISAVSSCLQGELEVFRFCMGTDPNTVLLVKCAYGMQEAVIRWLNCRPIQVRCTSTNGSVCHVSAILYIRVIAADRLGCRTSTLTPTNFQYQRLMIHPISDSPQLTTLNLPSALSRYCWNPASVRCIQR